MRSLSRGAGIAVGAYFVGIIGYLLWTAVIPLTTSGGWRGAADVIAVGAYLLSGVPLIAIALQELGVLHRNVNEDAQVRYHATYVALFLVIAHVAMIFGMLSPEIMGWSASPDVMEMMDNHHM